MGADPAQYQIGWMFFRNGPIFQQPFGANWQFGMELSSSTVYCDSISVLAFPFKLLKAWLPGQFQYFGIWILICYLLQAVFAWKLLGRLTQGKDGLWRRAVATAFFLIAPIFLWRIRWHFGLGAHWLLLAAFYLYFSPGLRAGSWIILLLIASLVTPVVLGMNMIVFGAALARQYFGRELSLGTAIKTVATASALLLFVMWEAGYFMVSDVGSGGFGIYRTSLLGFIDPAVIGMRNQDSWSYLFPDQPQSDGNYEGFCFLGAGMILLAALAFARVLLSGEMRRINWKKLWPIFLILAFSVLFALSNNIGAGPHILIHYNVPFQVERIISPFRASGRFIWLACYLLMAGTLPYVLRSFGRVSGFILLSVCLILQVGDSWKALKKNRSTYNDDYQPAPLNSAFWQTAAEKYKKVLYVPPQDTATNYQQLCYFAASHHLPISLCRYARTDEQKLVATRLQALEEIDKNGFDRHALYVFETPAIWVRQLARMRTGDWAGTIDGYPIVAPNWSPGIEQDTRPLIRQALPKYSLGAPLRFGANDEGLRYLANGWAPPEEWGVWSNGAESLLTLQLSDEPRSNLILEVNAFAFIDPKVRRQAIEVLVNGTPAGELVFALGDSAGLRSIRVPQEALGGHGCVTEIKFQYSHAISPARLDLGLDPRIIALGLRSLTLRQE
jgi:hypothetical protein